jgi:hypothetical protein
MRLTDLLQYTTRPPKGTIVVLPFANQETIEWLGDGYITLAYANQPRNTKIFQRDVFTNPPKFAGAYVVAQPPFTRRNDASDKAIFDLFGTDNLYKCFIKSLLRDFPLGGIIVLPFNFITGTRDSEIERRRRFFNMFDVKSLTIFSEIEIEMFKPMVLEFSRKTENSLIQTSIPVTIVNTKTKNTIDTVWHTSIIKNRDFIKESSLFYCKYSESPPANKRIQVQIDSFDPNINDGFYLSKSNPIALSLENYDNSRKLVIKGYLSKRLKRRIVEDFNTHVKVWLNATDSLFINNILINGNRESIIEVTLAMELIRRIIWSYFTRDIY